MREITKYMLILLLFLSAALKVSGQESEQIKPRLSCSFLRLSDGTKRITVKVSARVDDERVWLENAGLEFYTIDEQERKLLGEAVSDYRGQAVLDIPPDVVLPKDDDGYFTIEAMYIGSDEFGEASSEIKYMEGLMEIAFTLRDSVKYVVVHTFTENDAGEKEILSEAPVEFYIKRMFSLYRFGQEVTDETGISSIEFPHKMPGDTLGRLTVVVKIVDDDRVGSLERSSTVDWGTPLVIEEKPARGLGDTNAPLWMVYTLIVLLSGVWIHVLYVLAVINRINLIGKRKLKEAQY